MQLRIDTLQIRNGDFLLEDHLVERSNKVRIQESSMEDAKTQASTNELEVVQMFRVDTWRRVDLKRVVIMRRVLEQTIEGVEHLVWEQEEEFSIWQEKKVSMET